MGEWNIYGDGGQVKASVKKLEYNGEFMGERSLTATIYSPSPIAFEIGDYITYRGEDFVIDYDLAVTKQARSNTYGQGFVYDSIKFSSRQMELTYCKFLDYVISDNQVHYSSLPTFSFYCETITDLTDRIKANLDRVYTGTDEWTITVNTSNVTTGRLNIDISGATCWDALALVNSKFNTTFVIRGRTIEVAPSTNVLTGIFQYGKGEGLRSITKSSDPSQGIVTRIRAMGNTTNMPLNYYRNKNMNVYAPITEIYGIYESGADIHTTLAFNNCFTVGVDSSSIQYRCTCSLDKSLWIHAIFSANNGTVGYSVCSVGLYETNTQAQLQTFLTQLSSGTYTMVYFKMGVDKDKWPSAYREYTGTTVDATGETRLMLPGYPDSTTDPYIDSTNLSKYGVREESVLFDGSGDLEDIYPTIANMTAERARAAGATISLDSGDNGHLDEVVGATQITDDGIPAVEGESKEMASTFTITIKDIGFDINEYLSSNDASISMRDGMCEGREFVINSVTKSGNKYQLTCERYLDDSLNRYFPYDDYNISAGDKFVLLNIEMPELYIDVASIRLQEAATAYIANIDHTIFAIEPKIDNIKAQRHDDEVESSGTGVKIYNTLYEGMLMQIDDGDLDIDDAIFIDRLTIKEGESLIPQYEVVLRNEKVVGTVQQIQNQIADIKAGGVTGGSVDANAVNQLIKNYGNDKFLSKVKDDIAKGRITFQKGLQIGSSFVSGIAGGQGGLIDKDANAELQSLVLRSFLQVPELRYNRVMVELGDKWNAPGAGIIEEVTPDEDGEGNILTTGTCKLKLEEGEYGAIAVGDICMGIFHSEATPSMNANADSDDGKGNFHFAGFYTTYFRITSITNAQGSNNNQYFTYALRPTGNTETNTWSTSYHPSVGMHFVVYGSFTNTSRQTSVYTTRKYTRMLKNQNTWQFTDGNIAMQYGDMSNLTINGQSMDGYSIYLNNVYFSGVIRQVDSAGNTIMTANDRGAYVSGETYAYYDRVSTSEGLWLCVNESGTNTAPSSGNSDWMLQVPAGESLTPYGQWDSTRVPYPSNAVVSYADRVWVSNAETSECPFDTSTQTQSDDWELLIDVSGITDGEDGASLIVQYSANGSSWHSTFASNDIYMRQKVGDDGTWSSAMRIVGEQGEAGADGAYTNYQFAVNQSATTAPSSGWQDAPPTVSEGYYLWMRVQRVASDGTESAWTAVRIKGDKGDDGESVVTVDLDNEIMQVACVAGTSYAASRAQTKSTSLNMYYGTQSMAVTSITVNTTFANITTSVNLSTKTITFSIAEGAICSDREYSITVVGTIDGDAYTRNAKVKLHGVVAGADGTDATLYELEPSVNTIAKYKDDTYSISTVSCTRIKYVGDSRSVTTDGTMKYRIDDTGSETTISNGQTIAVSSITKSITFYLYISGTLVDKERVPMITDGKDGAGFALAGAWSSAHGEYSEMDVVSMAGGSYVALHDTSNPPLYCYILADDRYPKTNDNGYLLTGVVNTTDWELLTAAPEKPLDSISDEFIFKNNPTKPSKPSTSQTDDYVPSGWTDDPVGVSVSFPTEWVCKRTRRNGVWSEYSDPSVFAQFGKDGSFKSRVFVRSNSTPSTPTGGSYENPIPTGWTDGIPNGTAILWSSVCTFHADGTSTGWSTPAQETDTDTLDIEFSPSETEPSAPTGSTPFTNHESEGWYDPNSPNFAGHVMIWRAERKVSNGVYDGAWTITRIYGEKGDSNVMADFDNEVQSVACDSTGKTTSAHTLTTNVSMWYGTTSLAISSITATSATNITVTPNASQKKVTFAIASGASIAEVNNITLTLKATHNSVEYTRNLVFTINGIRGGVDGSPAVIYSLVPSVSSVKKDKSGNLSVTSISCTRQKISGSTITNNTSDGAFTYSINGGSEASYTNNRSITISASTTRIQFFLRINSVLVDTETIPVISDGADGVAVAISSTSITYQVGNSGTAVPTGSWSSSVPSVAQGKYLWTKTVVTYDDGNSTTSYSVSRSANDGTSMSISSTSVTYAVTTSTSQPADSAFTYNTFPSVAVGNFYWSKTVVTYSDGTTTKSYSVGRVGSDGSDGTPGAAGENGKTTYLHMAYANSADGRTDFSTTYFEGALYIGTYTNYTQADSTSYSAYEWKRLRGEDGTSISISSQSIRYQVGNSGTTAPTGTWQTSVPTVAQGKYLWTRTIVTYSDGSSTTSYSVSRAATDGANGTSITIRSTSVTYAVTTSTSQPADSAFTYTSFPSVEVGKYYWVKTVVTYSDNTSTKSYSVGRVGADGEDGTPGAPGADGRTSYIHLAYANSSNGQTDFSTTYFAGALYMGTYTDYVQTDSTVYTRYEWKRIKGEDADGFELHDRWQTSGTPYSKNSVVTMGGKLWAAKADTSNPPMWVYQNNAGNRMLLNDGGYLLTGSENTSQWMEWAADGGTGKDGADGQNAIVADLDNEMDAVTIDNNGLTTSVWQLSTNVWFSNGGTKVTPSSITFSGAPSGVTCTNSSGAITINIPSGTNIGEKAEITITLNATIDGSSYSRNLVFTIKGVVGGVVYKLLPTYSTISKKSSGMTPSSALTARIQKVVNGNVSFAANGEAVLWYSLNGASYVECVNYSNYYWQVAISSSITSLAIQARGTDGTTIYDQETIPVVSDGADGDDGVGVANRLRYFRLSNSGTSLTGSGTGFSWSTSRPTRSVGQFLWACDVTVYTDGSTDYSKASMTLTAYCNANGFCLTGEAGDDGDRGPYIYQTKWEDDPSNTYYYAQGSNSYVNCTYYNGKWYICKISHTKSTEGATLSTTYWTEMSNMKYVATEVILADQGSISLFQSMSVKVLDSKNRTAMQIDPGGIIQYQYATEESTDKTLSGYMLFSNGKIGYYNASGDAIWEIGASGTIKTFNPTSAANGWRSFKYHLLHASNLTTAKTNAQQVAAWTSGTNGTAYELTSVASSANASKIGRTTTNQDVDGVMIPNGYYCENYVAKQKISLSGTTVYVRNVLQYTDGYKVNEYEVTWSPS